MRVEFSLLAEYASASADGRVSIIGGGIRRMGAPTFPVTIPSLCLLAGFEMTPAECLANPEVEVRILDSGGRTAMVPVKARLDARPRPEDPDGPVEVRLVWGIQSLTIPIPGEYSVQLLHKGRPLITQTLEFVVKSVQ